ncbi:MAG: VOC family protein [Actinomycetota bacterium]|nr:VOC family protein [Actinomycetota bacterium]
MELQLTQTAIDLGIVITDSEASLTFYRDLLGMNHEGDMPMPIGGGGTMHRLRCGDTLIKLVKFNDVPSNRPMGGGIPGATGYRYFTIHVANVEDVMANCEAAGVKIVIPVREARPGVTIGMVADPDGNIVEFVRYAG